MKKLTLAVVALVVATLVGFSFIRAQAAERVPAPKFLGEHYGWTYRPQETHWYSSAWDISCPEGRRLLPRRGTYVPFNWVCADEGMHPVTIGWRVSLQEELEESVHKRYTGGYDYTKSCNKQALPSEADPETGVLKECTLSINGNTRYTAFYHFRVDLAVIPNLPTDFPLNPDKTPKKKLGFTIYVTSGRTADSSVFEDLSKFVRNIQLVTSLPAASQQ